MNKKHLKDDKIITFIWKNGQAQSSGIYEDLSKNGEELSLVTVKRVLSRLEKEGILSVSGTGRSTAYSLTEHGKLIFDVNATEYCAVEPDARYGAKDYNFKLFDALDFDPFSDKEKNILDSASDAYRDRIKNISTALHKKELERFVIELSWKSSKIEGNTYTLLDTEKLILRGIEAPNHSKDEARMILNHKEAFDFIHGHKERFTSLTRSNIEDVHKIIVRDLNVANNIRSKPVGITGSRYSPLDNEYQIAEAIERLSAAVSRMPHGYGKALLALLGISYIQPFEDGNKRTARLTANALLLAHKLTPLSYRNVDEKNFREAMMVFYELNSLIPFKKIFIEQYDFAAKNYLAI